MNLDKSLRYYLAGPMTNIPQFNFPLFQKASRFLRGLGYTIISPHEQDAPEVQEAAWKSPDGKLDAAGKIAGLSWGQILAKDVELVADRIDGIIFLPQWWTSRGAKLEAFVGLLTDKQFGLFVQAGDFDPHTDQTYEADDVLVAGKGYVRFVLREYLP